MEDGRWKKEEGRGKREEVRGKRDDGRRKKSQLMSVGWFSITHRYL
jgi:hypothetical protein